MLAHTTPPLNKQRQKLAESFSLNGELTLKNRIVMAPMTRNMADSDLVPTADMAAYYARRASAGLIITEGTLIDQYAGTYTNVPGIYNDKQVAGWQRVVDAVHANGGKIFMQIWHVGRVSHPRFCNNQLPIAPSPTKMTGDVKRSVGLQHGWSRGATLTEIKELISMYARAAANAKKAGFDGIEIHGANGYLIDQFLHYHTNHRHDEYGNTPANMARFVLEIIDACAEIVGYSRVGLRLTPGAYLNEMVSDPRDEAVFKYLLAQLNGFRQRIAYVHTGSFDDRIKYPLLGDKTMTQFLRQNYQGNIIACGSYEADHAGEQIINGGFDLVAIGRPFIANHDLVFKIFNQKPLVPYNEKILNTILDPSIDRETRNSEEHYSTESCKRQRAQ